MHTRSSVSTRKDWFAMGIIVVGFLLIGIVVLVLFGETLNKIVEEPPEYRAAPSTPEAKKMAGKSQAQPALPDHR
jgi:hypothetical protein